MTITWDKGGSGEIVSFAVERVIVRSTIPAAPGTPLKGTLESGDVLELKVRGSKRDGDRFLVDGRTQNLRRDVREKLEALGKA